MTRPPVKLVFESALACSRAELWAAITDLRCLRREMMPYLRMTAPPGVRRLTDVRVTPGTPLFASAILYFGFLPLDHSRLPCCAVRGTASPTWGAAAEGSARPQRTARRPVTTPGRT
jgi:hypothetical protein